jgi:ubiquinone/menaquinone biosynthesis C-methylase UbiE
VHQGTDNSRACLERISEEVVGGSVCDVGCGTGALLTHVRERRGGGLALTGVDFVVDDAASLEGIDYVAARIEELPFRTGTSTPLSAHM